MTSPVTSTSTVGTACAAALDTIAGELTSQRRQLKLIASENYASPAVLLALGNWLSDKYAEGTVGHRHYAGCEMVDRVESIAAGHARELFGAEHAYGVSHVNDLPAADWDRLRQELHSQRLLGMALDAGGHLTHERCAELLGRHPLYPGIML